MVTKRVKEALKFLKKTFLKQKSIRIMIQKMTSKNKEVTRKNQIPLKLQRKAFVYSILSSKVVLFHLKNTKMTLRFNSLINKMRNIRSFLATNYSQPLT